MVKSVAEVECKHEPDCRVPVWAAVLAPAAPGDGALPPDARGEA